MPLNSRFIKIPEITRDSVQDLSDQDVGQAVTRRLINSIDHEIEYRRELRDFRHNSEEEIVALNNEIKYLIKL